MDSEIFTPPTTYISYVKIFLLFKQIPSQSIFLISKSCSACDSIGALGVQPACGSIDVQFACGSISGIGGIGGIGVFDVQSACDGLGALGIQFACDSTDIQFACNGIGGIGGIGGIDGIDVLDIHKVCGILALCELLHSLTILFDSALKIV